MNEIAQLAQQAITWIAPLLPMAAAGVATHVADGFLAQPGAKLFDWLWTEIKGKPAAGTLERAVAEPQNTRRLDALRLEIEELAEKDTEFRRQLEGFLTAIAESTGGTITNQTASPAGDNNKIGQATGTNNTIQIG